VIKVRGGGDRGDTLKFLKFGLSRVIFVSALICGAMALIAQGA
jgi:hypothetical protein